MKQPARSDKCETCSHVFARHFTTYDGKEHGCSYIREQQASDIRNDRVLHCYCKGFAIIQVYQPAPPPGRADGGVE
jgi:hypothetical protein